ncbi:MAG: phosphopantetheine-binding protein, partial [Planctomycetaceae bacterium]
EEAPECKTNLNAAGGVCRSHLLPLSARTEEALHDLASRYCEFLGDGPPAWPDVCYTAAVRRDHHDCRLAVLANSCEQAANLLQSFLSGQSIPGIFSGRKPFGRELKIAFLDNDQSDNWKPYVAHLVKSATGFAAATEETDAACQRVAGWSLSTLQNEADDGVNVLTAVGVLYAAGADLFWERLVEENRGCVRLPRYPWQRQRLWAPSKNPLAKSPRSPAQDDSKQPYSPAGDKPSSEVRRRPDLTAPYVAPRTQLESALVDSWAAILRINGIGIYDNFFELGGDSLQATILRNRLQEHLGDALPGQGMFQIQSVSELANYLRRNFPDAVRRQYPAEAIGLGGEPADGAGVPSSLAQSLSSTGAAAADAVVSIPRLPRDEEVDELLERLDELPDDEVESLLGEAIADGEVSYE